MKVLAGAGDVDLEVGVAAQRDGQGRVVSFVEAGVADDDEIAPQALAVATQPGLEVGRAVLLLTLEDVADVDRQTTVSGENPL